MVSDENYEIKIFANFTQEHPYLIFQGNKDNFDTDSTTESEHSSPSKRQKTEKGK